MKDEVKDLPMIFVFGSNEQGFHMGGAAAFALKKKDAVAGQGQGFAGWSYAIPTCTVRDGKVRTLTLSAVRRYVRKFIRDARKSQNFKFQVTRIGCGIAGFKDSEMAPLFKDAPSNCYFDVEWESFLEEKNFWGTF